MKTTQPERSPTASTPLFTNTDSADRPLIASHSKIPEQSSSSLNQNKLSTPYFRTSRCSTARVTNTHTDARAPTHTHKEREAKSRTRKPPPHTRIAQLATNERLTHATGPEGTSPNQWGCSRSRARAVSLVATDSLSSREGICGDFGRVSHLCGTKSLLFCRYLNEKR